MKNNLHRTTACRLRAITILALTLSPLPSAAGPIHAGWSVGAARDGYGTILYTADSGGTWTRQGAPGEIADVGLTGVHAVDASTAWVVGIGDGSRASIYRTDDAGATWQAYGPTWAPTAELIKVHSPDGERIWAVGSGTILHSGDGGATWDRQPSASAGFLDVNEVDALTEAAAWAAFDAGVQWTLDGGASWEASPDHSTSLATMGISAASADEAWWSVYAANPQGGTLGQIWHTRDGGETWARQGGDDLPGLWTISLVPVPVPAPLSLITLGTAALALLRRRSRCGATHFGGDVSP